MAKVKDPVCGMTVDTDTAAAQAEYEGQTYFFCSTGCAREFERHPVEVLERHEPPHTTRGPFTAPKFGSAGSGGAEYELPPEMHESEKKGRR
jgi:YHS domain-containing protein